MNDDAVVLKGGKGPTAHTLEENGSNERIIVEDCEYGFCHGCLTCGSESLQDKNVIVRRVNIDNAVRLLWLKLRPDTLQRYQYIKVEQAKGSVNYMFFVHPWVQFFDMNGIENLPTSTVNDVEFLDCDLVCKNYCSVGGSDRYKLKNFTFKGLKIKTQTCDCDENAIENFKKENVEVEFLKLI